MTVLLGGDHGAGDRSALLGMLAVGAQRPALKQVGIDQIYLGKKMKFLTVASNLESIETVWFGQDRKVETLDGFFAEHLSARGKRRAFGSVRRCVEGVRGMLPKRGLSMTGFT